MPLLFLNHSKRSDFAHNGSVWTSRITFRKRYDVPSCFLLLLLLYVVVVVVVVCVCVCVFSAPFHVSPILFAIVMNILSALFSFKHNQPGHTGLPFEDKGIRAYSTANENRHCKRKWVEI